MHLATISAVLDAQPETVWEVIADFGGLKRWSRAVDACITENEGGDLFRIVTIGDVRIRERLVLSDKSNWRLRYTPESGSVMPVEDMVVTMELTPMAGGITQLDWSIEGRATIDRDKLESILNKRYQFRIRELQEYLARGTLS